MTHRSDAADRLTDQLEREIRSESQCDHVIVAHSHGGNIATLAAHRLRQRGVDVDRLHLITMGTPFLEIRKTELLDQFLGLSDRAKVLAMALFLSPTYLIGDFPVQHTLMDFVFYLATSALLFAATLLFFQFLSTTQWRSIRKSSSKRMERLVAQTEGGASWVGDTSLVLRAIDDEAALSLAAGALTHRLSRLAFGIAAPLSALMAFLLSIMMNFGYWSFPILSVPIIWKIAAIIWSAAAGVQLSRGVFGRELLFSSMLACEVNCQQSPDVNGEITIITLKDQLSFRHSIHEIKEVPQIVANWIALRAGQRSTESSR